LSNAAGSTPQTSEHLQSHYYSNASIAFGCLAVMAAAYEAVVFDVLPVHLAVPEALRSPGILFAQAPVALSFGALLFAAISLLRREGRRGIFGLALGLVSIAVAIALAAALLASVVPGD
jgi:hypothetical protein